MPIVQRVTRISYIDELLAPHDNDFERATTTILHSTRATSCVLKKDIFFRIINRRSIGKFRDVILSETIRRPARSNLPSPFPSPPRFGEEQDGIAFNRDDCRNAFNSDLCTHARSSTHGDARGS